MSNIDKNINKSENLSEKTDKTDIFNTDNNTIIDYNNIHNNKKSNYPDYITSKVYNSKNNSYFEKSNNDVNIEINANNYIIKDPQKDKTLWVPDYKATVCYNCFVEFDALFIRKHHCRICGNVFCNKCCSYFVNGSYWGVKNNIKVCKYCNVISQDLDKRLIKVISLSKDYSSTNLNEFINECYFNTDEKSVDNATGCLELDNNTSNKKEDVLYDEEIKHNIVKFNFSGGENNKNEISAIKRKTKLETYCYNYKKSKENLNNNLKRCFFLFNSITKNSNTNIISLKNIKLRSLNIINNSFNNKKKNKIRNSSSLYRPNLKSNNENILCDYNKNFNIYNNFFTNLNYKYDIKNFLSYNNLNLNYLIKNHSNHFDIIECDSIYVKNYFFNNYSYIYAVSLEALYSELYKHVILLSIDTEYNKKLESEFNKYNIISKRSSSLNDDKSVFIDNKWHNFIYNSIISCVEEIQPSFKDLNDSIDFNDYIKILKIKYYNNSLCKVINGVAVLKNKICKTMPNSINDPKLIVLNRGLDFDRNYDHISDIGTKIRIEDAHNDILLKKINQSGANIILVNKSISRKIQERIDNNIVLVMLVKSTILNRVARLTKTYVLPGTDLIDKQIILGTCNSFKIKKYRKICNENNCKYSINNVNNEELIKDKDKSVCLVKDNINLLIIDGCDSTLGKTIIISGPDIEELDLVKSETKHLLTNVRDLYLHKILIKTFNAKLPVLFGPYNYFSNEEFNFDFYNYLKIKHLLENTEYIIDFFSLYIKFKNEYESKQVLLRNKFICNMYKINNNNDNKHIFNTNNYEIQNTYKLYNPNVYKILCIIKNLIVYLSKLFEELDCFDYLHLQDNNKKSTINKSKEINSDSTNKIKLCKTSETENENNCTSNNNESFITINTLENNAYKSNLIKTMPECLINNNQNKIKESNYIDIYKILSIPNNISIITISLYYIIIKMYIRMNLQQLLQTVQYYNGFDLKKLRWSKDPDKIPIDNIFEILKLTLAYSSLEENSLNKIITNQKSTIVDVNNNNNTLETKIKETKESEILKKITTFCEEPLYMNLSSYSKNEEYDLPLAKVIIDLMLEKDNKCEDINCKKPKKNHFYQIHNKIGKITINILNNDKYKFFSSENESEYHNKLIEYINSIDCVKKDTQQNNNISYFEEHNKYDIDLYTYGVCDLCFKDLNSDLENNLSIKKKLSNNNINYTIKYPSICSPANLYPSELYNFSLTKFFKFYLVENLLENNSIDFDNNKSKTITTSTSNGNANNELLYNCFCSHKLSREIARVFVCKYGSVKFKYEKNTMYIIEPTPINSISSAVSPDINSNNEDVFISYNKNYLNNMLKVYNPFLNYNNDLIAQQINIVKFNSKAILTIQKSQLKCLIDNINIIETEINDNNHINKNTDNEFKILKGIIIEYILRLSNNYFKTIEKLINFIDIYLCESKFNDLLKILVLKQKLYFRIFQIRYICMFVIKLFIKTLRTLEMLKYESLVITNNINNTLTNSNNTNLAAPNNNNNILQQLNIITSYNIIKESEKNNCSNSFGSKNKIKASEVDDNSRFTISNANIDTNNKEFNNENLNIIDPNNIRHTINNSNYKETVLEKKSINFPINNKNLELIDNSNSNTNLNKVIITANQAKKKDISNNTIYISSNNTNQNIKNILNIRDSFSDKIKEIISYETSITKSECYTIILNQIYYTDDTHRNYSSDFSKENDNISTYIAYALSSEKYKDFINSQGKFKLLNVKCRRNSPLFVKPNKSFFGKINNTNTIEMSSKQAEEEMESIYESSLIFNLNKNNYYSHNNDNQLVNQQLDTELLSDDKYHYVHNISNKNFTSYLKDWNMDLDISKLTNIFLNNCSETKESFVDKNFNKRNNNVYSISNNNNNNVSITNNKSNQSAINTLNKQNNTTTNSNIETISSYQLTNEDIKLCFNDNISKYINEYFIHKSTLNDMRKECSLNNEIKNNLRSRYKSNYKLNTSEEENSIPVDIEVTVYYPRQFEALRIAYCDSYEDFLTSITQSSEVLFTGGKSKANFLKTKDCKYIMKLVEKYEFKMFIDSAFQYFHHNDKYLFHEMPSALAKILGAYKIKKKQLSVEERIDFYYIILMENIAYGKELSDSHLNKYFNLNNLANNQNNFKEATTVTNYNIENKNNLNNNQFINNNRILKYDLKGSKLNRYIEPSKRKPGTVLLDTNFKEDFNEKPIMLEKRVFEHLKAAIHNDCLLLSKMNIMDYSMFIIIDDISNGLFNIKTLRLGIIDYVRKYTWDKQLEKIGKKMIFRENPTVDNPQNYKERFKEAMSSYFIGI